MPQANPTGGANSERLENVTFPQARIDINDNLEALQTLNSGNSEPSTKAAFMQWLDTSSSPAVLKVRNAGNTSWIEVGSLSSSLYKSLGVTDVANGGTGATTAAAGIAALLPSQSGNSGKTLTTDGSALSWAVSSLGASVSTFSSNTTFTPETARSGFLFIIIGGGGSSGGGRSNNDDNPDRPAYSGSGGSAATAIKFYSSSELGSSAAITVGSGGAVSTGNGNSGGSSSVNPAGSGATCTAGGGGGSNYASAPSSGFTATAGGSAGSCSNHLLGWNGTAGITGNETGYTNTNAAEFSGNTYGNGGAGKHHPDSSGSTGNAGGAGYIVVFQW
jgi:hypothetical protein